MPFYHRVYSPGELQFITTSTYRRTPLFLSDRFRRCFVQRLEEVRQELHFLLIGWVLMPEHFHVLIKPEPAETTPLMMKGLKAESAKRIIKTLRDHVQSLVVQENACQAAAAVHSLALVMRGPSVEEAARAPRSTQGGNSFTLRTLVER